MDIKRLFTALLVSGIFSFSAISQSNYFGVTGNMVSGDFDNDGFIDDIAAFNTASESPTLTLWISNQGFINEEHPNCLLPFDFLSSKSLQSKIVSGDFDNDGFVDDIASIYEVGLNNTSITVWINNDKTFKATRFWYGPDFDANQTSKTIVSGDFDNDGFKDDIAAFYNYEQKQTKVYVWKSNGEKFAWPGTWWIGNDFNATKIQGTIVAGDFDHDGFEDDIASLYNYDDDFCRAFVWISNKNKFNWPYTWFEQENFAAKNLSGNVVAGDFNKNGFNDNIAALYKDNENNSSVLVFEKGKKGFNEPEIWWYGNNEAITTNSRLVSIDINENNKFDQFAGMLIENETATIQNWTATNRQFTLPENLWQTIALSVEDCEKEGSCLPNELFRELTVYPNPSEGELTVQIPYTETDELANIVIYNTLGSKVFEMQAKHGFEIPLNLTHLDKGTYLLQIISKENNTNKKIIIK
ncbi:MAG: T9SS type A sorting domain-containing protein [Salinivirgaceae bacterium]|nr:T9SS type A sorting domain-containing protein [Salinivirgaceae bacterium]